MKLSTVLLVAAGAMATPIFPEETYEYLFAKYVKDYGKNYETTELFKVLSFLCSHFFCSGS
jgi:hypothetical protein